MKKIMHHNILKLKIKWAISKKISKYFDMLIDRYVSDL